MRSAPLVALLAAQLVALTGCYTSYEVADDIVYPNPVVVGYMTGDPLEPCLDAAIISPPTRHKIVCAHRDHVLEIRLQDDLSDMPWYIQCRCGPPKPLVLPEDPASAAGGGQ